MVVVVVVIVIVVSVVSDRISHSSRRLKRLKRLPVGNFALSCIRRNDTGTRLCHRRHHNHYCHLRLRAPVPCIRTASSTPLATSVKQSLLNHFVDSKYCNCFANYCESLQIGFCDLQNSISRNLIKLSRIAAPLRTTLAIEIFVDDKRNAKTSSCHCGGRAPGKRVRLGKPNFPGKSFRCEFQTRPYRFVSC